MVALATIPQLRILLCVTIPFACLVTYARLYIRYTRGKLWWDDFWAFVCTLCSITFVAAAMLHVADPVAVPIPQQVKASIYYMCAQFFYSVVWTARISILFTTIRLSFGRFRKVLFYTLVVFFLAWLILFSQVWWVCEQQERDTHWKENVIPQCNLGVDVAIAQLITDVISDLLLVAAPMYLLWSVQLGRGLKLRLRAVFATTLIGTAFSLYHAYCLLIFSGIPEFLAATIQLAVSLTVANLPVLVAVVFQLKQDNETDNTAPISGIVTIGAMRNRKQMTTTFGGTTTLMDDTNTHLNVHVIKTNDQWKDDTLQVASVYDRKGERTLPTDSVEMKVVSTDDAFAR